MQAPADPREYPTDPEVENMMEQKEKTIRKT